MKKLSTFTVVTTLFVACLSLKPASASTLGITSSETGLEDFIFVAPEDTQPTYSLAGIEFEFLTSGVDSKGKYSAYLATFPQGGTLPLAIHSNDSEAVTVLDGQLTLNLEGQTVNAPSGSFFYLPAKRPRAIINNQTTPARALVYNFFEERPSNSFVTPVENLIKQAGVQLDNSSGSSPDANDLATIVAIALNNGIQFIPTEEPGVSSGTPIGSISVPEPSSDSSLLVVATYLTTGWVLKRKQQKR
ncbi:MULTISPECIES: cupin domain-containing protein [unclassified Nostoc]|uniref:cupin domain-containing protein n=1 Tax=unclassified Nostoc TaxID=2593658 RepID=UPI0025AA7F95|nr:MULTISPECIES: cupin domain-containing protein [unclassified Nostoc]MDM9584033.1 cupin domain-containing protein [Nostoc sp. GT001]MDZ7943665.1 cupin domain-containing protein [Nostoc sp. EfeVER01]MDZ7991672.1 cupin domain-containing protein [Nostoc sp. EspVER01]